MTPKEFKEKMKEISKIADYNERCIRYNFLMETTLIEAGYRAGITAKYIQQESKCQEIRNN